MTHTTLIEIPQWGTVNLLELVWTAVGGATVLFVLCMLNVVVRGWQDTSKGTIERKASFAYVRREIVRLAQGGLILGVGVFAAIQPSPIPGPGFITISGLVQVSAIYLIAILVLFQSMTDWQARNDIIRDLQKKGVDLNK